MSERVYKGDYGFTIEFYIDGALPPGLMTIHYVKPDGTTGTLAPTSVSGSLVTLTVPAGLLDQVGVYTFYIVSSDASSELTSTAATLRVYERGE